MVQGDNDPDTDPQEPNMANRYATFPVSQDALDYAISQFEKWGDTTPIHRVAVQLRLQERGHNVEESILAVRQAVRKAPGPFERCSVRA